MRVFICLALLAAIITGCSITNQTVTDSKSKQVDSANNIEQSNLNWDVSHTFDIPFTGVDGKEHKYILIGEKGKLGFIIGGDTGTMPIIAGKENKYMWHFWGNSKELDGPLKIVGISKETGQQVTVFKAESVGGSNNGANAASPTTMTLPTKGLWRLEAYIGDKLFGSVIVQVQ